jgi:hypothetical protein
MSTLFPIPRGPLDAAVRAHLEGQGRTADAERVLAGVLNQLDAPAPVLKPRRHRALVSLVAAAALLLGLFALAPRNAVQASPAAVVRQAQMAHEQDADRCYAVTTEPAESLQRRLPKLDFRREALLWTRGDRYVVEGSSGERKWTWGRDPQGRVWLTGSPSLGLRFDADELPEALAMFFELRAVRLPTLLGDVLRDCELTLDESGPDGVRTVIATPKPDTASTLAGARLEIDEETGVVRKLVLRRRVLGRDIATITLTLTASARQGDERYQLEGHLRPDARILDRNNPRPRQQALLRLLGGMLP